MTEGVGKCMECGQTNSYVATSCWACGARLPWADVSERARDATPASVDTVSQVDTVAPVPASQATAETAPAADASLENIRVEPSSSAPSSSAPTAVGPLPSTPPPNLQAGGYHCCGLNIDAEMNFCPKCGRPLKAPNQWSQVPAWNNPAPIPPPAATPGTAPQNSADTPSWFYNVVSFLFPIVGIIFYFVARGRTPLRARVALIFAGVSVMLNVIFFLSTGNDPSTFYNIR